MSKKRATEDKLAELHGIIADKLIKALKSPKLDLKALDSALRYLKDNKITADIEFNESLQDLQESMNNKINVSTLPFPKVN